MAADEVARRLGLDVAPAHVALRVQAGSVQLGEGVDEALQWLCGHDAGGSGAHGGVHQPRTRPGQPRGTTRSRGPLHA